MAGKWNGIGKSIVTASGLVALCVACVALGRSGGASDEHDTNQDRQIATNASDVKENTLEIKAVDTRSGVRHDVAMDRIKEHESGVEERLDAIKQIQVRIETTQSIMNQQLAEIARKLPN